MRDQNLSSDKVCFLKLSVRHIKKRPGQSEMGEKICHERVR